MLPLLGLQIYHSLDFETQIGGGEAFAVRDAGDDNPGSKIDAEAGRRVLIRRFLPMAFFQPFVLAAGLFGLPQILY